MIKAILLIGLMTFVAACRDNNEPIIVYSGKGLKLAMDEVAAAFEKETGTPVQIVYAGSDTLLATIRKTDSGDIYVPGSQSYIKDAGDLIVAQDLIGHHVPTIAVNAEKSKEIKSFAQLSEPGRRIAVGNADMAAIGRVTEAIWKDGSEEFDFSINVVVTASTVNELLQLVVDGEIDAAPVWRDMLSWEGAENLSEVPIPENLNKIKEIRAAALSTSHQPKKAQAFLDFMISKGRNIFAEHGFRKD